MLKETATPNLREVRRATELGYKGSNRLIRRACEICGRERWVSLAKGEAARRLCKSCSGKSRIGEKNPNWKGGRARTQEGYIRVALPPHDFLYPMAHQNGYVLEHRLVMARSLGRNLLKGEYVHHKNGTRDDNRIENLELVSPSNHTIYNQLCVNCELRKEIRLLRWQIKELSEALQEELRIQRSPTL